ncbi:MAG: galactokinase [Lachnospiraceae bacterium]|nr:galactokinase [Lachnospiraceae bacterium]
MDTKLRTLMETKFRDAYGLKDYRIYFAPGRVNLIGEHTDYNGGHVFPCAISFGTYALVADRNDDMIRISSLNFEEDGVIRVPIRDLNIERPDMWTKYPLGVFRTFKEKGYDIQHGFDILIYGDIPNGAGLSSSASLEVLIGTIIKDSFELSDVSMVDVALFGQYAENNYCGCNCGIMDQFASAMGRENHAILLDTNELVYEYVPLAFENEKIVITNSKVKHNLADGGYNKARNSAEAALAELQKEVDIKTLGDLTEAEFESYSYAIENDDNYFSAKHAVYENRRVLKAVEALRANNFEELGKLMYASHMSLRDDYQVSCEEIDLLVDLAHEVEGVWGSRITGGGFGGCTVSIVKNEAIDTFIDYVGEEYKRETGIEAEFYVVEAAQGAGRIE